jgi:heme a synthase
MIEGKIFRKLGLATIGVIYLLILVGGIVRATGSGMGCPDWPKCFGMWVPPTSIEQLPANFQTLFGAKLKGEVEFNVTKTWVEYLNRLLGVLSGFFVFGSLIASFSYFKKDKWVTIWSFIAFIGIGFQGWLGSKVVSTELKPVMVSIHMMVAILIVFVLIYAVARSYKGHLEIGFIKESGKLKYLILIAIVLTLSQILLGTQMREAIDKVSKLLGEVQRPLWIENTGQVFITHRTFSWIVLAFNAYLFWLINRNVSKGSIIQTFSKATIAIVVFEIVLGVVLAYAAMLKYAQPLHLTGAVLIAGLQFCNLILVQRKDSIKD